MLSFICLSGSFLDRVRRVLVTAGDLELGQLFPEGQLLYLDISHRTRSPGDLWLLTPYPYLLCRASPGQKGAHLWTQMMQ